MATVVLQTGALRVEDTEPNTVLTISDSFSEEFEPGLVECLFPE